jgi:hypothetical protein
MGNKPPTWRELCKLQPGLKKLHNEIRTIRGDGEYFCANSVWYGYDGNRGFKERLLHLVGFYAKGCDPRLKTAEAYDVAYEKLYYDLPD